MFTFFTDRRKWKRLHQSKLSSRKKGKMRQDEDVEKNRGKGIKMREEGLNTDRSDLIISEFKSKNACFW